MASLNTMVKQCHGLVGTNALTQWEDQFLRSLWERTQQGTNTTSLTEKQIDSLEKIYDKHFCG